ncbi:MAG: 2-oxoacid:ferredoxin oxidoreductase subunit beta, partial [Gammaproteobacteria bacterium]|nr:2-oxoacid:ferredoxin oxidoreductase subunit beta [Gammaproteobacteria bacterium]
GSVDSPIQPGLFAIGAGATFIARAVDIDQKGLPTLLTEAKEHQGTAFVEILQNCIVYNKDVFDEVVARKTAAETQIHLVHGSPLRYGQARDRGLVLNKTSLSIECVHLGEDGLGEKDLLVHDETNPILAQLLVTMSPPLPVAMGVIFRQQKPAFESTYWANKPRHRRAKVVDLLRRGNMLDRRDK